MIFTLVVVAACVVAAALLFVNAVNERKAIRDRALSTPTAVALRSKDFGLWQETSWAQYWDEIQDVAHGNRDLLTSSHRAAQETILGLQETVQTYDPRGTASSGAVAAQLIDESF